MRQNIMRGFLWGLLATLGMTAVMLVGFASGMSPMPRPIPVALAHWVLGDLPMPALVIAGLVAHFVYGGAAGALLYGALRRPVTVLWAMGFAVILWLGMQLVVLPVLGWGVFGAAITPKIAVATLVLHLLYGLILGLGGRKPLAQTGAASPVAGAGR